MQEIWVRSLGQEDPLEKEMATRSNILAWKIPWTEEPDGLRSMGLQSGTQLSMHTCTYQYVMPKYFKPFQVLSPSIFKFDLICLLNINNSIKTKAIISLT